MPRIVTTTLILVLLIGIGDNNRLAAAEETSPFTYDFDEIATDIWVGVRPDSHRHPVMGNTTFVVGETGVIVFDGGGLPVMADLVIDKIRSITSAPVTHVIISHWHGDHCFGISRYAEEYPGVAFVTHAFTDRALRSTRMNYINTFPNYLERRVPFLEKKLKRGEDGKGQPIDDAERTEILRGLRFKDVIAKEYKRARLTMPTLLFTDNLTLYQDNRRIDLKYIGHGNTEGDIIMWLPEEKIVATGDLVVYPTPYAFNVPPRAWAKTLKTLNALGYQQLIPGHGVVQTDTRYVDLLIETADGIADQRDKLLADGVPQDDIPAKLDFSNFDKRFVVDDPILKFYYNIYFTQPLRAAAIKELSGKPMVEIIPRNAN